MNGDSSRRKICLVIPYLQSGGMERVMAVLANYFAERKEDEIHLVLYGMPHEIFYKIHPSVIFHNPPFKFNNRYRFINTLRTLWFVRKTISNIKPYSILSFGHIWNSFVMLALLGVKKKIYLSDRAQPDLPISSVQQKLRRYLYPLSSGIIAQTKYAQAFFRSWMPAKPVQVIANPIERINTVTYKEREKIILAVGRLIKTKHHDVLINIFNRINNPEWKLIIVGADAERQNIKAKLQQQVNELGLHDKVVFTGALQDVQPYYLKSKIFAFTSSTEGFPNVLGEAMAAGAACISFDCIAGPADIIEDGVNGFLVPLFDEKKYEEKLVLLMNDETLCNKIATAGFESIKKYDKAVICEEVYSFITA